MPEPRRPRVPDPSATIPDFGPRPDVRVLEKRAEVIRMLEGDAPAANPSPAGAPAASAEPAPARRTSPLLVLVVALVVAVLAGSASFFVIVFAGLAMYAVMGI